MGGGGRKGRRLCRHGKDQGLLAAQDKGHSRVGTVGPAGKVAGEGRRESALGLTFLAENGVGALLLLAVAGWVRIEDV